MTAILKLDCLVASSELTCVGRAFGTSAPMGSLSGSSITTSAAVGGEETGAADGEGTEAGAEEDLAGGLGGGLGGALGGGEEAASACPAGGDRLRKGSEGEVEAERRRRSHNEGGNIVSNASQAQPRGQRRGEVSGGQPTNPLPGGAPHDQQVCVRAQSAPGHGTRAV